LLFDTAKQSVFQNAERLEMTKLPILAAIMGNGLFILWITYNGINEGFAGTLPEKVSYICLLVLLGLNTVLLARRARS
jgi:hypothetical protein